MIITYIKVLVNWRPKRFRIVQTLLSYFVDAQTIFLLIWMAYVFIIPTVMAWLALSPHQYGYHSMAFAYEKIMAMSTGGWLYNKGVYLHIEENLATLLEAVFEVIFVKIIFAS